MCALTIATRGSKLALWQAEHVKARILELNPLLAEVDLLVLKTKGDKILDVPLAKIGGKGLFVKEIEEALLDGRADVAVHSIKDVPMTLPPNLALGAIMEREDARDMFLSMRFANLDALPPGARVGTSSLRRQAGLLRLRPDLAIVPLRGNVDTRLAKLAAGEFDAVVMAAAGVKRLGLSAPCMVEFPETAMLPAAGQGALGLEYRVDDKEVASFLTPLDHEETHLRVMAERGVLAGLGGGCQTPMAAHAKVEDGFLVLEAMLVDIDGKRVVRETTRMGASLGLETAYGLGLGLADKVRRNGGEELLAELLAAHDQ